MTKPLFARNLWVPCRDTVAHGLAIGLFFSMFPPFTPQSILAAIVAMRAKANVPFAMAAAFVSNVVTTPPIVVGQNALGGWLYDVFSIPGPRGQLTIPGVGHFGAGPYILGFIVTGVVLALLAYPIVHLFSALMPHHLPVLRRKPAPIVPQRPSQTGGN